MRSLFSSISLIMCLAGCSSGEILRIRSLGPDSGSQQTGIPNGQVQGLERASMAGQTMETNVLFVHGIGWTTDADKPRFGLDFVDAVEAFYKLSRSARIVTHHCPISSFKNPPPVPEYPVGGLKIISEVHKSGLVGDDPNGRLISTHAACMDKTVLTIPEKGRINVYRLLLDQPLYDAYQFIQLGYDDEGTSTLERGYENLATKRASVNRLAKDSLVNYGLSDAAMYMGPVGAIMRDAFNGAICAVISDAGANAQYFSGANYRTLTVHELCGSYDTPQVSLTIFAESLGSRLAFDALTTKTDARVLQRLKKLRNTNMEVFLLANQIPLIGLSRLRDPDDKPNESHRVRFVAISEVNDLLTYELVPYFEHLYAQRCRDAGLTKLPECTPAETDRFAQFEHSEDRRRTFSASLGFDVIDARVQFAGPLFGIFPPLRNPLSAHTDYLKQDVIRQLIFCGADDGKVRGARTDCTTSPR